MSTYASSSRPTKKRGKSSKSSSRASEVTMYRETIADKDILSTKFFCEDTLESFQLMEFTAALLENAGLKDFHEHSVKTYPKMTREFLATMEYKFTEAKILESLSFEYQGKRYVMSAADVREALSISGDPSEAWGPDTVGTQPAEWWFTVTGTVHGTERDTYNINIPNPALVLCHKVLAMCFCGKGEVNKVPAIDLQYLWSLAPECPMIPDWAGLFVTRCHEARSRSTGKIAMGGMITLLVLQFANIAPLDLENSADPPVRGGHVYSHGWLQRNHIVEKLKNRSEWLWPFGRNSNTFIHLPKRLQYGPSLTFRLHADDITGMVPENTAFREKLAQLQEGIVHEAQQVPIQEDEEMVDPATGDAANWDRLWARLDLRDNTDDERHAGYCQEFAGIRQDLAGVRREQTRASGYWQQFYNYEKAQWDQYWVQHPPPPPPGQY